MKKEAVLWGLLSFCIPIVGLIVFLVKKNDDPETAKIALIAGIVGFAINVIFMIVNFVVLSDSLLLLAIR